MIKIMVFIDGSWLYKVTPSLRAEYDKQDFRIDYGKLPRTLAEELAKRLGAQPQEIDVVRCYLFASIPVNYDMEDDDLVRRQRDFYNMLKEEYHYEIEAYQINFHGSRVRRTKERLGGDRPDEKCVDVALASTMLYYAAIPNAYDVAVAVIGDRDYVPALQHVRRLGRRVAIASVDSSCSRVYRESFDSARVRDFDLIFLDDLLDRIELRFEPKMMKCESGFHEGDRLVLTTFYPRKGKPFYCEACIAKFHAEKRNALADAGFLNRPPEEPAALADADLDVGESLTGEVKRVFDGKFTGYIAGDNGRHYGFGRDDLAEACEWYDVGHEGVRVAFEINRQASEQNVGLAMNVRVALDED